VTTQGADLHLFVWERVDSTDTPTYDDVSRQSVDPRTPIGLLLQLILSDPTVSHAIRIERSHASRVVDSERLLAPA
jgi:hypothetical protein